MSAHTPGPWFWSRGIDDWELVGAGAERVLFCWSDKTKWKCGLVVGENIKQADARLIAAAPDMYEALKEMVRVADANGIDAHYARAVNSARAALAKAGQ